ncbi:MAG: hypothetical protein QM730_00600 [Anaerolineales bacterium]
MKKQNWFMSHFEIANAILIALVSLTTALSVWRTNVVGSNAADESRIGLIDAVKNQSLDNESYRKLYEEAGFSYQFAAKEAEAQALEASQDAAARDRGKNIRQYLLPNMKLFAEPLATDETYRKADGTFDLEKRFSDLQKEGQGNPDPATSFARANSFFAEQRWLVIGSILLALSLFWLTLAEINERLRGIEFVIGLATYVFGVAWFLGVEFIFFLLRRGA